MVAVLGADGEPQQPPAKKPRTEAEDAQDPRDEINKRLEQLFTKFSDGSLASQSNEAAEAGAPATEVTKAGGDPSLGSIGAGVTGPNGEPWCWAERAGDGVNDIKEFLASMGLEQYHGLFVGLGFDTMTSVRAMEEQDMRDEIRMADEHIKVLHQRIKDLPPPPPIPAPPPPLPAEPLQPGAVVESIAGAAVADAEAAALAIPEEAAQEAATTEGVAIWEEQLKQLQQQLDAEVFSEEAQRMTYPDLQAFVAQGVAQGSPVAAGVAIDLQRRMELEAAAQELAEERLPEIPAELVTLMAAGALPIGDPIDTSLFALAQVAEEAAQMAAVASAFCSSPQDFSQVVPVAEAAEMAAERAKWAAQVVSEMGPTDQGDLGSQPDDWLVLVRELTLRAAEVAESAWQGCKVAKEEVDKYLPKNEKRQSKLPCKHFLEKGTCREGNSCRFSHDPMDSKPRPLMLKRQEECRFFKAGKCARGAACAWAHGEEELEEITKYICRIRDEKFQMKRAAQKAFQGR